MDWVVQNWQWILLGLYTAEKIVRVTPTKYDDIVLDMIIKPVLKMIVKPRGLKSEDF